MFTRSTDSQFTLADRRMDSPVSEYIMWKGERVVPKDKVEQVRAGRAHIAAEIRRVVERVEVEKGPSAYGGSFRQNSRLLIWSRPSRVGPGFFHAPASRLPI